MKCYHPHTYEKLGFDAVLAQLSRRVSSEAALARCEEIVPLSEPQVLLAELHKVNELLGLLQEGESLPRVYQASMEPVFKKLRVAGHWLSLAELRDLIGWLRSIAEVRRLFHQHREKCPEVFALTDAQPYDPRLEKAIARLMDERGNLRDDASPELARIRKQMKRSAQSLRQTLNRILRHANQNQWSLEKEITLRNDRLVIPVKAEAKRHVPGFVQDVSQSGGTVYVEPAEALPLNNELRELQIREQNEILRLLQEISAQVRAASPELDAFREILIQVDLLQAKARLALDYDCVLPVLNPAGKKTHLLQAYYFPLLVKAKESPSEVIPLELQLSESRRIMVISGPNAGGKSVSLKTVGLLQLMLQAGFLVPVSPDSTFRIFHSLFVDIGDEQSVDNDLSTYTSHLAQWRQMGDHMDADSLFLIDEFGSGTDPKQGGAIAEAFLERFVSQKATGIITTHYGNLKEFAEVTRDVINAAMQFDTEGLRPTFRLTEGVPGRSYAFEMARRVGVHPTVLKRARKKVGSDDLEAEQLIQKLERKNSRLTRLVADNQRKAERLEKLLAEYEEKDGNIKQERKRILREAQQEARQLIQDANRRIEATIREIKEKKAEKEATRRLRKRLAEAIPPAPKPENRPQQGSELKPPNKRKGKKQNPSPIQVFPNQSPQEGDWVKLASADTQGQLVEIQGKKGLVESGGIRLTVKLKDLVKISPPQIQKKESGFRVVGGLQSRNVSMELRLMGKRVEEALMEVDRYLDEVRLAGLSQVRILHGKGTGALREAIRKHVLSLPFVEAAYDAPIEQGGAGWTVLELKE